jgi:hypothetical protein
MRSPLFSTRINSVLAIAGASRFMLSRNLPNDRGQRRGTESARHANGARSPRPLDSAGELFVVGCGSSYMGGLLVTGKSKANAMPSRAEMRMTIQNQRFWNMLQTLGSSFMFCWCN